MGGDGACRTLQKNLPLGRLNYEENIQCARSTQQASLGRELIVDPLSDFLYHLPDFFYHLVETNPPRRLSSPNEDPDTEEQNESSHIYYDGSNQEDEKLREFENRLREAEANQREIEGRMEEKIRRIKEAEQSWARCLARISKMQRESADHERRCAEWSTCFRGLIDSGDVQKWQAAVDLKDKLGPEFTQGAVYQRHAAEYEQGLCLTEQAIGLAEEDLEARGTSDISSDILEELCGYARESLSILQMLADKIQVVGLLTPSDVHNLQDYAESMNRLEARCNALTQQLEPDDMTFRPVEP